MKIRHYFFTLISILFISCNFETLFSPSWDDGVKDFFEEYTNTAAIETWNISVEQYSDNGGNRVISSDKDCKVSFYMRNPQKYTLDFGKTFPNLSEGIDTSVTIIQQSEYDVVVLSLPQSFLIEADKSSKNISHTISLTEPKSGRKFDSYTLSLFCNSKPPEVSNAVAMQSDESESKWVICFDMPSVTDMAGIHSDLSSIAVSGVSCAINNSSGRISYPSDQSRFYTSLPEGLSLSSNGNTGASYVQGSGQASYFITGEAADQNVKFFTLLLTDSAGLTSSFKVSSHGYKLSAPSLYNVDDSNAFVNGGSTVNQIVQNDDGSGSVKIEAPAVTEALSYTDSSGTSHNIESVSYDSTGASIVYEVYSDSSCTNLISSGSIDSLSGNISLPAGDSYVKAYVKKSLYTDSDTITCWCKVVRTRIYVTSESSGGSDSNTGNFASPVATISKALSLLDDKSSSLNTIYLLSDLSGNQNFNISGLVLTVKGVDSEMADTVRSLTSSDTSASLISVSDVSSLTLDHIALTSHTSTGNGGGINLSSGSLILMNTSISSNSASLGNGIYYGGGSLSLKGQCNIADDIYIPQSDSGSSLVNTITVDSSFNGSAKVTLGLYQTGLAVLTASSMTLTQAYCNQFTVTEDSSGQSYVLSPGNNGSQALLALPGIESRIFDESSYTISLNSTSFTKENVSSSAASLSWTIKEGSSVIADSSSTALASMTSASITLYSNGQPVSINGTIVGQTLTNHYTPVLTLPSWLAAGSYQVKVEATINLYSYSDYITITVTE